MSESAPHVLRADGNDKAEASPTQDISVEALYGFATARPTLAGFFRQPTPEELAVERRAARLAWALGLTTIIVGNVAIAISFTWAFGAAAPALAVPAGFALAAWAIGYFDLL